MNIQALLKQAQKMQKEVQETENELKGHIYESEVSGAIKVIANGSLEVTEINILDEDLLSKENKEILQDMILMAVNETIGKAKNEKDAVMNKLTAGVKMPGGF